MPKPLPPHPNVRNCTHIKVTGQRCGSPALRGEFFCYFHTRVIKGVQQRVDMQLHSMALLEDCESIQLSIMHVVDSLLKGTLDATRARLIIQALRIAAKQEAKLWELRVAVSIARLRRDQGHLAEARDLLAPVYGWFTEGFDTPDLQEAKALLEALNA